MNEFYRLSLFSFLEEQGNIFYSHEFFICYWIALLVATKGDPVRQATRLLSVVNFVTRLKKSIPLRNHFRPIQSNLSSQFWARHVAVYELTMLQECTPSRIFTFLWAYWISWVKHVKLLITVVFFLCAINHLHKIHSRISKILRVPWNTKINSQDKCWPVLYLWFTFLTSITCKHIQVTCIHRCYFFVKQTLVKIVNPRTWLNLTAWNNFISLHFTVWFDSLFFIFTLGVKAFWTRHAVRREILNSRCQSFNLRTVFMIHGLHSEAPFSREGSLFTTEFMKEYMN